MMTDGPLSPPQKPDADPPNAPRAVADQIFRWQQPALFLDRTIVERCDADLQSLAVRKVLSRLSAGQIGIIRHTFLVASMDNANEACRLWSSTSVSDHRRRRIMRTAASAIGQTLQAFRTDQLSKCPDFTVILARGVELDMEQSELRVSQRNERRSHDNTAEV